MARRRDVAKAGHTAEVARILEAVDADRDY